VRRQLRMAALAISVVLALGTLSFAQDDDDYYRGNSAQTRQYGYDNGYRDGQRKGQHEGRENDPFDCRTPDWRQASHGYKSWMGPLGAFQDGYQQGYRDGFGSGFLSERPGWRAEGDGDRGDHYGRDRFLWIRPAQPSRLRHRIPGWRQHGPRGHLPEQALQTPNRARILAAATTATRAPTATRTSTKPRTPTATAPATKQPSIGGTEGQSLVVG